MPASSEREHAEDDEQIARHLLLECRGLGVIGQPADVVERHLRIELAHGALHLAGHRVETGGRPDVHDGVRRVELQDRNHHHRLGPLGQRALLDVLDDADHGDPLRRLIGPRPPEHHTAADRIAILPVDPRHRLGDEAPRGG